MNTMSVPDLILSPGTTLRERYRIEHTISRGGFGNVYLARDAQSGGAVAIKEAFYSDDETRKQFEIESQVLIRMDHHGVVHGYGYFEERGRFYLVMQYITGMNLEEMQIAHFKAYMRPLPETTVLPLMILVCAAAEALHREHILHRDIKPANIKIDESGQPILLDLGLAKLFHDPNNPTLIAAQAYTPGYAPPEQCMEGNRTTSLTDVYALGGTMYYALTGRQPWDAIRRLTETHMGNPDMPSPRDYMAEITIATNTVVMRALQLNPAQRFPSVEAMRLGLEIAYRSIAAVALCPNCHMVNTPGATYCGNCGAALRPDPPPMSAPPASINFAQAVPPDPDTMILRPAPTPAPGKSTTPMILQPEPVRPRIAVKPKRSILAGVVLFLGVCSLCPATTWLSLLVIPLGLATRRGIARSGGTRSGMSQATIGLLLGLASLAYSILFIVLTIKGVLHPFGN